MLLTVDNHFHRTARYPANIRSTSTKCKAFHTQPTMVNSSRRLVLPSKIWLFQRDASPKTKQLLIQTETAFMDRRFACSTWQRLRKHLMARSSIRSRLVPHGNRNICSSETTTSAERATSPTHSTCRSTNWWTVRCKPFNQLLCTFRNWSASSTSRLIKSRRSSTKPFESFMWPTTKV